MRLFCFLLLFGENKNSIIWKCPEQIKLVSLYLSTPFSAGPLCYITKQFILRKSSSPFYVLAFNIHSLPLSFILNWKFRPPISIGLTQEGMDGSRNKKYHWEKKKKKYCQQRVRLPANGRVSTNWPENKPPSHLQCSSSGKLPI